MLSPARVDAVIDLAYGALIILSIGLIATLDTRVGLAFGVGVFVSYVLHVVWKMARFDPDWMTKAVEETVEKQVEDVQTQVEQTVGETVEEQVEDVQTQVAQTVGETIEETVGETVEETVEQTVGETVEEQVEDVQTQVEAVNERVDRRPREDEVEEIIEESVEDESET
ncbi:hypothetical protein [Natrinema hispanicum]|uniref:Glutamate/valine-rich protein n=1 Tax=Natrinema hispanicum TaxID=392421 RepID=A0A1I0II85_9EURY|nr:hypothetical protein [Natrinema hispanicum]SDD91642.1 hypothetical protein SAMN05192552_10705 [Natrinema hispanicum]SET96106.1 hypothetical protein SAMN04488694_12051 [Natrinema hispanicum]